MSSLIFSLLAAVCGALSSFFFRKNGDNTLTRGNPAGFLLFFYFSSFILSLFYPGLWKTPINFTLLAVGAVVGLMSSFSLLFTVRALEHGPAGLTFAFLNASAIFPGLILFMLLGPNYGYPITYLQLAGIAVVLLGLFWGALKESLNQSEASFKWLGYAVACFIFQILVLTLIQARCLLFDCKEIARIFSDFSFTEADDRWFMPGQFGAGSIAQALFFFLGGRKKIYMSEFIYGCGGGIANLTATIFILVATKSALPFEKALVFPCYGVATMILCNIWANRLYNEKFNFVTNALCSLGIFMAIPS